MDDAYRERSACPRCGSALGERPQYQDDGALVCRSCATASVVDATPPLPADTSPYTDPRETMGWLSVAIGACSWLCCPLAIPISALAMGCSIVTLGWLAWARRGRHDPAWLLAVLGILLALGGLAFFAHGPISTLGNW